MVNTHHLKCWPEYFDAVYHNIKPFEVRRNDRNYQVGDILVLQEYDPDIDEYTGRETRQRATYILRNYESINSDYIVIAIKPEPHDGEVEG